MTQPATTLLRFAVSARIIKRLDFLDGRSRGGYSYLIHRVISAGDLVLSADTNGLDLLAATGPLVFPTPQLRTINVAHTFAAEVLVDAATAFEKIVRLPGLDQHSALSWCILCYEIIDEAQVTNRAFYRNADKTAGWRSLWI